MATSTDDGDDFRRWLSGRLREAQADEEVFSPYILSMLEEAEEDPDRDDVAESLADVLSGMGLEEAEGERLGRDIRTEWSARRGKAPESREGAPKSTGLDLQAQLASIRDSQTERYKAKKSSLSQQEMDERQAVKAAILAKYENTVEESDDDEEEVGKESGANGGGDLLSANTNADAVAKEEIEKREKNRAAAQAKKDKDKEDREKQKKQAEEKKKKAQEKTTKGERRR